MQKETRAPDFDVPKASQLDVADGGMSEKKLLLSGCSSTRTSILRSSNYGSASAQYD